MSRIANAPMSSVRVGGGYALDGTAKGAAVDLLCELDQLRAVIGSG